MPCEVFLADRHTLKLVPCVDPTDAHLRNGKVRLPGPLVRR